MFVMSMAAMRPLAFDLAGAVQTACRRAGLKQAVLAELMGTTEPRLSQMLAPGGHLSLTRLLTITDTEDGRLFWRYFLPALAGFVGVEQHDAVAAQLSDAREQFIDAINQVQRRMAKAELEARDAANRRIA